MGKRGWQALTFVLAAALAVVATGLPSRQASAKPPNPNGEALETLGMLEVARQDIARVPKDSSGHKAKALESLRKAREEIWIFAFGSKEKTK